MKRLSILLRKKPGNKTSLSASTVMSREDSVLPPSQPIPSSAIYHRSCKTLPLEAFIQAYCNNDLSGILRSGESDPEELQSAWNEILFDYASLFKTKESDYLFNLSKEIGTLNHHIIYVQYAVEYLRYRYRESFAQELRNFGYTVPLFEEENYRQSLELILSLAKSKVFELNNLQDEYDRLNKTSSGKAQSEDEFIKTVSMLSKYQGYHIDTFSTTVYRFVMTFNNYLTEMAVRQKALNNG